MSGVGSLRAARAAFVFLTRLPVGGFPYTTDEFRSASAHFPLVGLAVGAVGATALVVTAPLGPFIASLVSVALVLVATGALHEDGLADTADALGGSHDRAKLFEILKDSRVGTFGACALVISILARVGLLAELLRLFGTGLSVGPASSQALPFGASAPSVLMVSHCLARTGPVCLMVALPYVTGDAAKSSAVAAGTSGYRLVVALTWTFVVLAAAVSIGFPMTAAAALVMVTLGITAGLGIWFRARAGGYTGDFLGATEQILEVCLLACALASSSEWEWR